MHICLVLNSVLPPRLYGGAERVVFFLGKALNALGHQVTFLAKESQVSFAKVIQFNPDKAIDDQIPNDVDIVHLHSNFAFPKNFPFCITIHGNSREAEIFHPNTIFVSKNQANMHGGNFFIHNGIDSLAYRELNSELDPDSFCFLGNASWKVKNMKGAIKVAEIANSKIHILGGKRFSFKRGLNFSFSLHAQFHGMVNDNEKSHYLSRSRGLIFPVLWHEPFGLAVIESLYFGVPVFGTPYGSLPEIVPSNVGFLSNSASELARAIQDWEKFDRKVIHNYWKKNFSSEVMANKYIEAYSQIINGKNLHESFINGNVVRNSNLLDWRP